VSDAVRIYVNAQPVDVPAAATVLDAVALWNPEEAELVRSGHKQINDSRGLAAAPAAPVHNGAIFRLVRARSSADEQSDTHFE